VLGGLVGDQGQHRAASTEDDDEGDDTEEDATPGTTLRSTYTQTGPLVSMTGPPYRPGRRR
jgi:hypothetical protein